MVTQNTFIRTINEILFKINKQAGEVGAIATTIEEAHEMIKKHRTAKAVTQSKR
jgi:hypothetical protein